MNELSINIHDEWIIDENVKINLIMFWFKPPIDPVNADIIITVIDTSLEEKYLIKMNGAIFCQTRVIKQFIQDKRIITWGNQKWKGAIPALITKAMKIIMFRGWTLKKASVIISDTENTIIIIEAKAWGIKYLIAASDDLFLTSDKINGMNLIKLISNPIQAINHELEEAAITVPEIKNIIKIKWKFFKNIKKKEDWTLIEGVWTL